MKTRFTICVTLLFAFIFSEKTFAQRDAGGSTGGAGGADGNGTSNCVIQPTPTSFKRNNGGNNGNGTCGIDGQIRLTFKQDPSTAPVLVGLYYPDWTPVNYIYLPISANGSDQESKKVVSYCLPGGNIDPAKKLIAVFRYEGGCQPDIVLGE